MKLPRLTSEGHLEPKPEIILSKCIIKKGQKAGVKMLVKWKGLEEDDAM